MNNMKYPKSIYKFCNFDINEKTQKVYSIENLINNQVWLTNPLTFNDTFDCTVGLDQNKIINEIAKNDIEIIQKTLSEFRDDEISQASKEQILKSSTPVDGLNRELEKLLKESDLNLIKSMFFELYQTCINDFHQKYISQLKVSCFSESLTSLLMWGHYADRHKGFCLEYDLESTDFDNISKYLFPVKYGSRVDFTQYYIDNIINKKNINKAQLIDSVIHKSLEWEYEQEWRFVISNSELTENFITMPKPKAIYIGAKILDKRKKQIFKIAQTLNIPIFSIYLDNMEYKLKISENINEK